MTGPFTARDTVLVTGGAGFIGSAVVHHLLETTPANVVVLDAFTYAANEASLDHGEAPGRLSVIRGSVADPDAVKAAMNEAQPRAVLHLAAESHVDRSIDGPGAFVDTNVTGTFRLLEGARAHWETLSAEDRARFRFVHVSTDEVFGSLGADDPAFCETTPYDPRSPYSATKAASDHLARAWWHTYTLPVCVTNCTNNYGPRQFPEKLIPLLTLKALTGETLPVYGQGENVRDWLFVDDHARGLCRVAERGEPGATYCFGGNTERTNLQVVEALCDAVDALCAPLPSGQPRRSLIEFVADRPGHDFRYAMKTGFVDRALGWQPSMRFEEGLRATIQWYLDNEAWWRPLVSARYAGERLGLKRAS